MAAAKRSKRKIPAGPPVRVEIRINGRVRFANTCYGFELGQDEETMWLEGSLVPTLVDKPTPTTANKFGDDVRDGEQVLTQVHSGRRT